MQVIPFVADTAAEAVAQIRKRLGPDAVVVNVRKVPPDGLSKLWKKPRIEVLACRPEAKRKVSRLNNAPNSDVLLALIKEVKAIKRQLPNEKSPSVTAPPSHGLAKDLRIKQNLPNDEWRMVEVLEASGMLPVHALRVVELMQKQGASNPPTQFAEELALAKGVLKKIWQPIQTADPEGRVHHVMVGPAGSGKTTCLCKWLTQAVIVDDVQTQVWRLDGGKANAAESLSVYCEILGVDAQRTWAENPDQTYQLGFIDLPGIDWWDSNAMRELSALLQDLGPIQIHLVLNLAYETPLIMAQAKAFAELPVHDCIVTHLDEEVRWGKIWNLVMDTQWPVRYLSAGQNIPGDFSPADLEQIFSRQFPID